MIVWSSSITPNLLAFVQNSVAKIPKSLLNFKLMKVTLSLRHSVLSYLTPKIGSTVVKKTISRLETWLSNVFLTHSVWKYLKYLISQYKKNTDFLFNFYVNFFFLDFSKWSIFTLKNRRKLSKSNKISIFKLSQ